MTRGTPRRPGWPETSASPWPKFRPSCGTHIWTPPGATSRPGSRTCTTSCRSTTPGRGRSVPTRQATTPMPSRRSSVAEPAVTLLDEGPKVVPTRFGGLQPAAAMPPVVPPGPHGRHLLNAGAEEIEAVICRVWPGGRDAERRRTRGARIHLQHLDGFPRPVLAAALGRQRAERIGPSGQRDDSRL